MKRGISGLQGLPERHGTKRAANRTPLGKSTEQEL